MSYVVAVEKCADYAEERVSAALAAVLAPLGGLSTFVKAGDRVLLKLNLLADFPPEKAVTTHPSLVKAVIRQVQALGATPVIGDSPAGKTTPASYAKLLQITGIQQVIDETGCAVVSFEDHLQEVSSPRALVFKKFLVTSEPSKADVVIALPKLKTHQLAYYTGAVKLLYGYLPGLTKVEHHLHAGKQPENFAELLLDLYEALTPHLVIMDAVVAMEGAGPSHGTPRQMGLLLASPSGTALDFLATYLIGLKPLAVPTVSGAQRRGIGPGRLEEISVLGEKADEVRLLDFQQASTIRPTFFTSLLALPVLTDICSWLFAARPAINAGKCIKCGKCAESCPPKTIAFHRGQVPRINYSPCLRCYCCQELCPVGAVVVRPPRIKLPK